jgi:predicted nucleic acid-binding protein
MSPGAPSNFRLSVEGTHQIEAVDGSSYLVFAETRNAIWKKVRRRELSSAQGQQLVNDLGSIAVETITARAPANDAYSLAISTGCSVYDAMYLALAVRLDTKMLTADERLANSYRNAARGITHPDNS